MAITLFTGVPGAGKTLRSIFDALEKKAEGRMVFHIGIDGMKPDIIPESPVPLEDWKKLPAGSVLIVDEAHKYLPVRSPGKPPQWIQDITEIRHFGIELYLVTQDPRNIDSFVRRLIGEHKHLSRKAGLAGAMVRTFQGVSEDPNDWNNRQSSSQVAWKYPKHLFQVYKSASLHVVKPKIPKKIIFAVALVLASIIGIPLLIWSFKDKVASFDSLGSETETGTKSQKNAFGVLGSDSLLNDDDAIRWRSIEDYQEDHAEVVPGLPWTAPALQRDLVITTHPDLLCVIWDKGGPEDRCTCYNEQNIRIRTMPEPVCRIYAEEGVYNPYRHKPEVYTQPQPGGASVEGPPASRIVENITLIE